MSCRHDLAIGTCTECYPATGTYTPVGPGDSLDGPGAVRVSVPFPKNDVPAGFANEPFKILTTVDDCTAGLLTFGLKRIAMSSTLRPTTFSDEEQKAWASVFGDSVAFMCLRDIPVGGDDKETTFETAKLILEFRTRKSLRALIENLEDLLTDLDDADRAEDIAGDRDE